MKKIVLDTPVTVSGHEYKELTMREPKVRDQLFAAKQGGNDAEKEVIFVSNLCEVAPEVIHELSMRDYRQVQEELHNFLS